MAKMKFERAEDGLFHCDFPDCEQPGYELPQHLGLHRFHQHGIKSAERAPRKAKASRPRKKTDDLSAEEICFTVIMELEPSGSIPVALINDYIAWVDATRGFLAKMAAR